MRELEALAPMRFTLITERRRHPPRGRDGGADGATGRNLLNGEPSCPSKAPGSSDPATGCGSRPPAAAAGAPLSAPNSAWRAENATLITNLAKPGCFSRLRSPKRA